MQTHIPRWHTDTTRTASTNAPHPPCLRANPSLAEGGRARDKSLRSPSAPARRPHTHAPAKTGACACGPPCTARCPWTPAGPQRRPGSLPLHRPTPSCGVGWIFRTAFPKLISFRAKLMPFGLGWQQKLMTPPRSHRGCRGSGALRKLITAVTPATWSDKLSRQEDKLLEEHVEENGVGKWTQQEDKLMIVEHVEENSHGGSLAECSRPHSQARKVDAARRQADCGACCRERHRKVGQDRSIDAPISQTFALCA